MNRPSSTWMLGFGVEVLDEPDDAIGPLHLCFTVYLVLRRSAYTDVNLCSSSVQIESKLLEMN